MNIGCLGEHIVLAGVAASDDISYCTWGRQNLEQVLCTVFMFSSRTTVDIFQHDALSTYLVETGALCRAPSFTLPVQFI